MVRDDLVGRGFTVVEGSVPAVFSIPKTGTKHKGIFKGGTFASTITLENLQKDENWQPTWRPEKSDIKLIKYTVQILNMVLHPSAAAQRLFSEFAAVWARGGRKPWMIWLACKWLVGNKDAKKNAYAAFHVARCYMHAWEK